MLLYSFPIIGKPLKGGEKMNPDIINTIKELVMNLGFPIVCVGFMWHKITQVDEKQTALLTELITAIKDLSDYIIKK